MLTKIKVNYIHSTSLCVSEELKSESDLHRKLGKAIQTEAINPMNRILQDHEKKKKIVDNTVEKAAEAVTSNWRQQLKTKKKLKELTKDHEALFRDTESSFPLASPKSKKKFLKNLEKSAIKLAKEDEDYYKKNLTACETRVKWEQALENGHQASHQRFLSSTVISVSTELFFSWKQLIFFPFSIIVKFELQFHEAPPDLQLCVQDKTSKALKSIILNPVSLKI
uniref:F-BAR domain-containing protein n=2 Tax=Micrurus spixii TaxID=129469 RepID=A0A2D4M4W5_9SAUR